MRTLIIHFIGKYIVDHRVSIVKINLLVHFIMIYMSFRTDHIMVIIFFSHQSSVKLPTHTNP